MHELRQGSIKGLPTGSKLGPAACPPAPSPARASAAGGAVFVFQFIDMALAHKL